MSGLYLHIPFCHKSCYYCDFHFSVSVKHKPELIRAINFELKQRKNYLDESEYKSIYFGGGTPSVMSEAEIFSLLGTIYKNYKIATDPEITFEANPDDLTPDYLKILKKSGVNRLSIGIQSFFDDDLKFMNRNHDSNQALSAIYFAREAGFDNLNIDLIYGIPGMSVQKWEQNLLQAVDLDIPHLSCYHLGIEPKTVFYHRKKKGQLHEISEEESALQFSVLRNITGSAGYTHYEISNFAKQGKFSRHNLIYWQGDKYAGFGPSAHSYNIHSRQWNININSQYIEKVKSGSNYFELEVVDENIQYNELIMTSLRTIWGLDRKKMEKFRPELKNLFNAGISAYIKNGMLYEKGDNLIINPSNLLVSDGIISDLMFV